MPEMNRKTLINLGLPILAAVLLMGVSCYYQGIWSERWGEFPELEIFAQQLKEIPKTVGEWEGVDGEESSEEIKKISRAAGEMNRLYKNPAGEEVRVMIMCARFRDIFNHTPERCYPAAGFEMMSEPQREVLSIDGKDAQFFTTSFRKSDPTGTHEERGYWTWTADGTWLAPTNERLVFGGERALYKLYVFAAVPNRERARSQEDFREQFIREFIPAATRALRPAFEKAARIRSGEVVDASATPVAPAAAPAAKEDAPAAKEAAPANAEAPAA